MIFVDILMKNYASTTKSKTRGLIGMGIVLCRQCIYGERKEDRHRIDMSERGT